MARRFNKLTGLLAVISLLAVGGGTLTSCENKDSSPTSEQVVTCTITWTVDANVTLAVEGYTERPTSVDNGTKLTFTITPNTGYEVTAVKLNGKRQTARNGKYTVTISVNATIIVEASPKLSKIEVTTNPTDLTYFAGESVDTTGMVVTAYYETGTTAILSQGDDGYSILPASFSGGETSFTVNYGEKEAVVNLDKKVEYLVTLDVDGGTIDQTWLTSMEALNLNNYNVDDNGVVTFSYYNDLPQEIVFPTAEEITREDYTFKGWGATKTSKTYETKVNNNTKTSSNLVANWQPDLVELTSASLAIEENVPYLVIEGKFKAANEVYLFLYEGNDKISLKGGTYTGTRGDSFTVKFDLTKLKDATTTEGASYEGKWMDIRFNATDAEGNESTMEIFQNMVTVDTSQKIELNGYTYLFATYNDALKVYFKKKDYSVALAFSSDNEANKDYLTITGTLYDSKYYGKTARLSWWITTEAPTDYGLIGNDGTFTIQVDLADIAAETNGYAHFAVVESETDSTVVMEQGNLLISNFTTAFPALEKKAGNDIDHAVKFEGLDGYSYYAGYAWDGLMIYKVNEKVSMTLTGVTIALHEGAVYFAAQGTYNGYAASDLKFGYDIQHNGNVDGQGWGYIYSDGKTGDSNDYTAKYPLTATANETDKTFTLLMPLSALDTEFTTMTSAWTFSMHYYFGDNSQRNFSAGSMQYVEKTVVKNGYEYSIVCNGDTWNNISVKVQKTDAADTTE